MTFATIENEVFNEFINQGRSQASKHRKHTMRKPMMKMKCKVKVTNE
jgi:hypothetical protein